LPFTNENSILVRQVACILGTGSFNELNKFIALFAFKISDGNDLKCKRIKNGIKQCHIFNVHDCSRVCSDCRPLASDKIAMGVAVACWREHR